MANRIKTLRTKLGLTQKDLAMRSGTSQQQIQRIETGQVAVRLELAAKIAAALNSAVSSVFPGATKAIRAANISPDLTMERIPSDEMLSSLSKIGIEADPLFWTLRVLVRGQNEFQYFKLEPSEKRRLFMAIQSESDSEGEAQFVVFDSEDRRVGINLKHLSICQFLFDRRESQPDDPEEDEWHQALAYIGGMAEPLPFGVDADRASEEDEYDRGSFNNIFSDMDIGVERGHRFIFEDEDGEYVFIRAEDLALLNVPLWVMDPDLRDVLFDTDSED